MKRAALLVVVVVVAGLVSACLPYDPNLPAGTPRGFDACAAPSATTMSKWRASSPYQSVGVYIGGANRACAQPNLTKTWVNTVWTQGWKLLPIWVGPQAPCTTLSRVTKLPAGASEALAEGMRQATQAANAADALGLGWLAPIYYDMEAYPRGGACTQAIQSFTDGWVHQLNTRGYIAGMYSSLCSGILDQAASASNPARRQLNTIWIAAWNNRPQIYGFGDPCKLSNTLWNDHQRTHQYTGGHNETWGGVTINIDSNAVDGWTVPR